MKKNRNAILIFTFLSIVAAYFIFSRKEGTIRQELRDFTVEDTAAVDKIFLADKRGNQVLLERKSPAEWTLNGESRARQDGINLLLATVKNMEVRSPVGKAAQKNIIKNLAAEAVKAEIYQHGKLFKTIYVGGPTQDQLGTYMYLQNSTVPFIMHIPGFDGYLTPRFMVGTGDWKIKSIFAYGRGDIKSLIVRNGKQPQQSFELRKMTGDQYALLSFPEGKPQQFKDSSAIQAYLASYQFINYEKMLSGLTRHQLDSVFAAGELMSIQGTDSRDKKTNLDLYLKPADPNLGGHYDQAGKLLPFDPDRMIARLNQDTALIVVQYYSFDKLMKTLDELKSAQVQEKR